MQSESLHICRVGPCYKNHEKILEIYAISYFNRDFGESKLIK